MIPVRVSEERGLGSDFIRVPFIRFKVRNPKKDWNWSLSWFNFKHLIGFTFLINLHVAKIWVSRELWIFLSLVYLQLQTVMPSLNHLRLLLFIIGVLDNINAVYVTVYLFQREDWNVLLVIRYRTTDYIYCASFSVRWFD